VSEINAIFSKISDFLTKDFLAGSLIPALLFIISSLIWVACLMGWQASMLWADQLSVQSLATYGNLLFIGLVGLAYAMNATRELQVDLWAGDSFLLFLFDWLLAPLRYAKAIYADWRLKRWYKALDGLAQRNVWPVGEDKSAAGFSATELSLRVKAVVSRLEGQRGERLKNSFAELAAWLDEATSATEARLPDQKIFAIAIEWVEGSLALATLAPLKRDIAAMLQPLIDAARKPEPARAPDIMKELEDAWAETPAADQNRPRASWASAARLLAQVKSARRLATLNRALERAAKHFAAHIGMAEKDIPRSNPLWMNFTDFIALHGVLNKIRRSHNEEEFQRWFRHWAVAREPRVTALGNQLAAYRLYARLAYSFDGDLNWLRVGSDLKAAEPAGATDPLLQRIEDSRLSLYFCVSAATLALAGSITIAVLQIFLNIEVGLGAFTVLIPLVLALILYQAARVSAEAMFGSLKTAFDRYAGGADARRALEPTEQNRAMRVFFAEGDDLLPYLWRRLLSRLDHESGSARRVALAGAARSNKRGYLHNFASLVACLVLLGAPAALLWDDENAIAQLFDQFAAKTPRWSLAAATALPPCTVFQPDRLASMATLKPTSLGLSKSKDTPLSGREICSAEASPGMGWKLVCAGPFEPEPAAQACIASLLQLRPDQGNSEGAVEPVGSFVEVRAMKASSSSQLTSRDGLAGLTLIEPLAVGDEITADNLLQLTLVTPPVQDKPETKPNPNPQTPALPVRIELVASGGFAMNAASPEASTDIHAAPVGRPAGSLFFKTCSVLPVDQAYLRDWVQNDRSDEARPVTACQKIFADDLAALKLECSDPRVAAKDCTAPGSRLQFQSGKPTTGVWPVVYRLASEAGTQASDQRIFVFGFADEERPGSNEELNQILSTLRARVVAAYLSAAGIAPANGVIASGFGQTLPLLPASAQNGRMLPNRRVDVVVFGPLRANGRI
jgi:hypothetical protein